MAKPDYYHEMTRQTEALREKVTALEKQRDALENRSETLRSKAS